MAKLPTLNVDVAVNTKTMQKGIADANKKLQQVGGKVLAAGGGVGAKLGSFGSLGGSLGTAALVGGGILAAAMAPLKAAQLMTRLFVDSVEDSKKALDAWNTSAVAGAKTGISRTVAERMVAQEERAASMGGAWSGLGTAFVGAAAGEGGQMAGVAGAVATWAEEMGRGTKTVLGFFGALAGGKNAAQAEVEMLMAAEPENADRLKGWLAEVQQGKDVYHMPTDEEIQARVRARSRELDLITAKQMQQQQELFG